MKRDYKQEYMNDVKNTRMFKVKISRNPDADMIEFLEQKPSVNAYLKALIRADMEKQKEKGEQTMKKYLVEYTDNETGATSPIDNITAPDGYTAEDYIRDCAENADDDWNQMLSAGDVKLVEIDD